MTLPILTFDFKVDNFIEIPPVQADLPEGKLIRLFQSQARAAAEAQKESREIFAKTEAFYGRRQKLLEDTEKEVDLLEQEVKAVQARIVEFSQRDQSLDDATKQVKLLQKELTEIKASYVAVQQQNQELSKTGPAKVKPSSHGQKDEPGVGIDPSLVDDLTQTKRAQTETIALQTDTIRRQDEKIQMQAEKLQEQLDIIYKLKAGKEEWEHVAKRRNLRVKQLKHELSIVLDTRNKLAERLLDSNGGICIYVCPRDMGDEPSFHDFDSRHSVELYDEQKQVTHTSSGLDHVFSPIEANDSKWDKTLPFAEAAFADNAGPQIILAYGPTGSGKTWLMSSQDTSILPCLLRYLFQGQAQREDEFQVDFEASAVHAHRGKMYDLQQDNGGEMTFTKSIEKYMAPIKPADRTPFSTIEEGMTIFDEVTTRRSKLNKSNSINKDSSRSHFIFTVHISMYNKASRQSLPTREIYIVDLAGSEEPTGKPGDAIFEEGKAINSSLGNFKATLTAVIEQNRAQQHDPGAKKNYVEKMCRNFINDKNNPLLMYMLKPLLDERRRILFFACVYGSGRYSENARTMRQVCELTKRTPVLGRRSSVSGSGLFDMETSVSRPGSAEPSMMLPPARSEMRGQKTHVRTASAGHTRGM